MLHRTAAAVFGKVESYGELVPSFGTCWGFLAASRRASVMNMKRGAIARRLRERGVRTKFYDPRMHARMFLLPPAVAKKIKEEKTVSTRKQPAVVYSSGTQ